MSDTTKGNVDLEFCAKELHTPGFSRRFLVHNIQHVLPLRDFYNEIRAFRDVDTLFAAIIVQLDIRQNKLDEILKK